jgi:methyl-accepting chemotaxis protein
MNVPISEAEARRADAFLRLARGVGALLHESQRERGVSTLHVKSNRRLFASELASARTRTDARRRGAATLVQTLGRELLASADVQAHLDRIAAASEDISIVRAEIERQVATPDRVVGAFSALNSEMLSAVGDCVARVDEERTRCLALASLALLHAKEKTGLERARLGAAFVGGGADQRDRVALAELVAARASYLHVYSMTAPSPAAQMLRRVMAAPPAVEVRRIEDRIIAQDTGKVVDPNAWFSTITRTIEMMGDVAEATLSYFPAN